MKSFTISVYKARPGDRWRIGWWTGAVVAAMEEEVAAARAMQALEDRDGRPTDVERTNAHARLWDARKRLNRERNP